MLQIKSLSKSYGSKTLFLDATMSLGEKARIALVGPNGAGKSTLIKLILGQEHPDQGEISIHKHVRIGHLSQELPRFQNRTVFQEVLSLDGRREEVLGNKAELEEKLQTDSSEETLSAYSRVLEEFESFDEYRLPSRAEQILEGVGFKKEAFHQNLSELSGGWLMRVSLARILLMSPDLLVLDEPTNHLDLESLLWLEEFLKNYPGSLLLVSHDRAFQNRLVNTVWEIDQKKIFSYPGNLDAYIVQKEERLKLLLSKREGQDAKIADLQSFVGRFGAKATKARQAQSRVKQIEKLEAELVDLPESRQTVHFEFPSCFESGREVVTLKQAGMQFGEKKLFSRFNWILKRGARVAIVGVNGAGKTTLLKAISGHLPLTEGTLKIGHNVQIGYYSQMQAESLNLENTILQELEQTAPNLTLSQIRGVAGAFLFSGDAIEKRIRVLSGGEKARVALAKLLLLPHNFLLLDEPTNHLDSDSRAVLSEALSRYPGTLCLVSHDRDFVSPLVDELLEISQGEVIPLVITYEEYLAKKQNEAQERIKVSSRPKTEKPIPSVSKPSNNQVRSWEREFAKLETEIAKLEQKQAVINERLSTEDLSRDPTLLKSLIDEQTANQASMDQKLNRWEELGTLLGS